ncbi:glycerol-3-phosphate dehydrogenase/oxidase [Jiella sonneratiae]|uniref:Glycerol-3-phosphate dehydrogenase/oxidase n=1 Tax=Jiella sonneratiae TaxID=2816856 RepID=A0ABS3J9X7_9HYPH|nr:glycerol-3-phosphate dehydrogenase/oxidase [Jiella sonneratiae]MBO0906467.1 glycerol-3-phosphate dehydrogenase/oxidase [Jiella sonneratiae]
MRCFLVQCSRSRRSAHAFRTDLSLQICWRIRCVAREEITQMRSRRALLGELADSGGWTGVVILGGGINGIGVYRDLAAQGVPALLVDKGDFCSGTSAAPSRLIHGGLRYLETGEFALVRESVEERNHLLNNAPHLVRPLPVWVPLFSWGGGLFEAGLRFLRLRKDPGAKGAALVKIGLAIFDRFGRVAKTMPNHRMVRRELALAAVPSLNGRVKIVGEYYDARLTSPERLGLEIVVDAETDCQSSVALPYVEASGIENGNLVLTDLVDNRRFTVSPSVVVNCTGAWLDDVDRNLGIRERLTGGTKGSHLVLKRPDLAGELGDRMLYFETRDHRACLIYAIDEAHCILGTTDLRTDSPDDTTCSDAEIDYLFDVLSEILPDRPLSRSDIVFTYAGVRPLPATAAGATGAISRDHSIRAFEADAGRPFPLLALVGGKWTTYRACAEQIADQVLERIGRPRKTATLSLPIGGGRGLEPGGDAVARLAKELSEKLPGLTRDQAARLVGRYGRNAFGVVGAEATSSLTPLATAPNYFREEIRHIATKERVTRLEDVILRRTLLPFEGLARRDVVEEVGGIVGEALDWTRPKIAAEIKACLQCLERRYRVDVGCHGFKECKDGPAVRSVE